MNLSEAMAIVMGIVVVSFILIVGAIVFSALGQNNSISGSAPEYEIHFPEIYINASDIKLIDFSTGESQGSDIADWSIAGVPVWLIFIIISALIYWKVRKNRKTAKIKKNKKRSGSEE